MTDCGVCRNRGFYALPCHYCGQQIPLTERLADIYGGQPGTLLTEEQREAYVQRVRRTANLSLQKMKVSRQPMGNR